MANDDYKPFLVEYTFGNSQWNFVIHARNWQEAEERLKRAGTYGRVIGSDVVTVPAIGGPFVKAYVWLHNFWSRA